MAPDRSEPREKYRMQSGPDLAVISDIAVLHAVKHMVAAKAKMIHYFDCCF